MKKLFFPILLLILSSSCATIKVSSDFDKTAPFASYKTYGYTPDALNLNINELNKNRVFTAIDNELKLKGFTKSDNPDILIDIKVNAQAKQTATANTTGGYGMGYRYRWGGGFSTTTINYDSYIEGTLFIDMIDEAKKQLVWQGRGVKTLEPDASASTKEKNINSAVKSIFAKYPPKIN